MNSTSRIAAKPALASRTRALVLGCFFLSGATGLVYQGVWFRSLQALFGVTTHALAVVVAAFMGGLAAGSWVFGKIADRSTNPLRLYGRLEIGIGLLALLVAPAVAGIERLYVGLHPHLAGSLLQLSIGRMLLALFALLVPTMLMGGTLPALAVLLRRDALRRGEAESLHRDLGRLYGINTLGAVAGTILAGFVLLGTIGLWRTTLVAAAINVALGLVCIRWARRLEGSNPLPARPAARDTVRPAETNPSRPAETNPSRPAEADTSRSAEPHRARSDLESIVAPHRTLLLYASLAFAISGAVSLAYEVAWTRVLAQIIGSSTYAFTSILAAFLLGVGIGSFVLERWRGRDAAGLWGFCFAQLAIGASAALVVPLLTRLPDVQLRAFQHVQGLPGVLALQFGLCVVVLLLPTVAMGATFPLVAGFVASRATDVGAAIGRLYAGNTLGGIVGAMLAGFVLLPRWGTQHTLVGALCTNVVLALIGFALLLHHAPGAISARSRRLAIAAGAAALGLVGIALWTPPWDPYQLDAGVAIGGPATLHGDPTLRVRDVGHGSDILYYREGLNANVSVRKDETQLYLKTNGKTDGTSRGDMPTQLMLGLLPALVHPEPQRALVIGLGTGASARAATSPPGLQVLDAVEIEPAIVDAARRYFSEVNRGLFADRRARIWVDDARAFLLTTPERYDFIVSEPSNPWIAGVASLFSVEHYERCAARLEPEGILAQWLQIYAMRPELVRMVLASLHAVFPYLAVWSFHHGDLIVLASRAPLPAFDLARIESRLGEWGVRDEIRRVLDVDSAAGVLGFHLLDADAAARLAAGASLNTEDRPRLEFQAPRSLYLSTRDANAKLLLEARSNLLPALAGGSALSGADRLQLARAALVARRPEDTRQFARQAGSQDPALRATALGLLGEASIDLRQAEAAQNELEESLRLAPEATRPAQNLALLRLLQGRTPEARALLDVACAADPARTTRQLEGCLQLLELMLQQGAAADVVRHASALRVEPGGAAADSVLQSRLLGIAARAHLSLRDLATAEREARAALAMNPQSTAAWRVLGALAFEAKNYPEAIRFWERLIDYRQTGTDVLLPLAFAYQRGGKPDRARTYVQRVLAQEPQNQAALRLQNELR